MADHLACVELRDLKIDARIGSYAPDATAPDAHLLDLTLWIDSKWVLIDQDGMDYVFDYDPLVDEINRLAGDVHYETQERLITRVVLACVQYEAIQAVEISLRKTPVLRGSGSLGIRLVFDARQFAGLRESMNANPTPPAPKSPPAPASGAPSSV